MNVAEFASRLGGTLITGDTGADRPVKGMYCCDLLSWVMSHAVKDNAWITVHTHLNIVAVATLMELSCIIIPDGIGMEESTAKRAMQEGIPILLTDRSAYEICCIAHECSI
jgi:hypothetical protein